MKKILILLLLFFSILNSVDVSKSDKTSFYKEVYYSSSIKNIEEAISENNDFIKINYFRKFLRKKRIEKSSWYKFKLNNYSNKVINRQFIAKWHNAQIHMYLVSNNKIILENKLQKTKNYKYSNPFYINPNEEYQLYLNVKVNEGIDEYSNINIIDPNAIFKFASSDNLFSNGIFLGLLISMMMYNFFMYLSMKIKSYLYLGIYQITIILYISDIRYFLMFLLSDYPLSSYWIFKIYTTILISIFSVIFTKEFLSTKESMPTINKLLNFFLIFHIIFQSTNLHSPNYISLLYLLYILAGFVSFRQGNKFAIFYILGFSPTALFHIGINLIIVFGLNIDIEYRNIIQILAVIEAFSLSMALYLKLKQTVEEKEQAVKGVHDTEKLMLKQAKFATMGEMLASISHQWKQPLNHLTLILANLQMAQETNNLTKKHLNSKVEEANAQLKYMSSTIEDFNSFLSSKKDLERFILKNVCDDAIRLSSARIKKLNVKVELEIKSDMSYITYKNGLLQVVLIILNNALDALMLNNIENREIKILIRKDRIIISDNAGGISDEIIDKIFEPYFSTKGKKFGSGLGLYTAKIIIENIIKGNIYAKNKNDGVSFFIKMPNNT